MNYENIQQQFNEVIKYSQGIDHPNTDKLFSDWYNAKRVFIDRWGGKLIWEWPTPISFELTEQAKNKKIDDFLASIDFDWNNSEIIRFIEAQRAGFFSNQVVEDYEFQGQFIPKGMRLIKAFKFFESSAVALHYFQTTASMIMQENKIEGTLCLSVHPLDFLSSSENTHKWRSCHSLDGEYRSGNLSHMRDSSTIVCYLRSSEEEKLPNFPESVPWNSKKWRVLLFFSDDMTMLFAGRQYPFASDTGLDFLLDRAIPAAGLGDWSPWLSKKARNFCEKGFSYMLRGEYIPVGACLRPLTEVVLNNPHSLQFNDLLSSSCYDPVYAMRLDNYACFGPVPMTSPDTQFHIGGEVMCCHCGKQPIELSETFMCNDCELKYGEDDNDLIATCPCCGARFYGDEGVYVQGSFDELICPSCAENETVICGQCGERAYSSDATYDREHDQWLCRICAAVTSARNH